MKTRIITLVLSIVFLASCSSSRYGRIPKAKKQKHTVAKKQKQFKKNTKSVELIAIKKATEKLDVEAPEVVLSKIEAVNVNGTKTVTKAPEQTTLATPSVAKKIDALKQVLKPNKVEKLKKQSESKEISKGSWLWYVVVGIVLMLIGALIPIVGWVFYVIGVIAVIIGLLILLGLL